MSQQMNQGTNTASSAEAPLKRKRGRPRKDENQALLRPILTSAQGEGSGAPTPTANVPSKGNNVEDVNDDDHNNDEMVGQVVTGVVEWAFDAGYILSVRVGESSVPMRGVVFKQDCVVPVTPENDIAPNAKMYKRRDIPIPGIVSSRVVQTTGNFLKPTENIENQQQQQQQQQPIESDPQKEGHKVVETQKGQLDKQESVNAVISEQQEEKLEAHKPSSDDSTKKAATVEGGEKFLESSENVEKSEQSPRREDLEESSEFLTKLQKTDEMTVADKMAEDAVKSDEQANPPETGFCAKETTVNVVPMVEEQETCGTSGFQISMEDADTDEPLSEVNPMEAE